MRSSDYNLIIRCERGLRRFRPEACEPASCLKRWTGGHEAAAPEPPWGRFRSSGVKWAGPELLGRSLFVCWETSPRSVSFLCLQGTHFNLELGTRVYDSTWLHWVSIYPSNVSLPYFLNSGVHRILRPTVILEGKREIWSAPYSVENAVNPVSLLVQNISAVNWTGEES